MSENVFQSLDINRAQNELAKLYAMVALSQGRVELTSSDRPGDACVIISKKELESLEKALQILADSDSTKALAQSIHHACDVCDAPSVTAS